MDRKSAIFTRRSIRAYDPSKPASAAQINDVLDAAMHAPTAMGKQPWEFLVVTNPQTLRKIMIAHPYCGSLADAGTAIIVCGNLDREFKSVYGGYHPYDCSAAAQNLMLRAKELGLGSCWCGIEPDRERMDAIRKLFNIPKNIAPVALIILGTPAESVNLDSPRFDENKIHREFWL